MKLSTLAAFIIITFYLVYFSLCFNETQRQAVYDGTCGVCMVISLVSTCAKNGLFYCNERKPYGKMCIVILFCFVLFCFVLRGFANTHRRSNNIDTTHWPVGGREHQNWLIEVNISHENITMVVWIYDGI